MSNHATAQSLTSAGAGLIGYDTPDIDPTSLVSGLGGTAQITVPVNGIYLVTHTLRLSAQFDLSLAIYQNGAQISEGPEYEGTSGHDMAASMTDLVVCNAGDYLQGAYSYCSGAASVVTGQYATYMSVAFLRLT